VIFCVQKDFYDGTELVLGRSGREEAKRVWDIISAVAHEKQEPEQVGMRMRYSSTRKKGELRNHFVVRRERKTSGDLTGCLERES